MAAADRARLPAGASPCLTLPSSLPSQRAIIKRSEDAQLQNQGVCGSSSRRKGAATATSPPGPEARLELGDRTPQLPGASAAWASVATMLESWVRLGHALKAARRVAGRSSRASSGAVPSPDPRDGVGNWSGAVVTATVSSRICTSVPPGSAGERAQSPPLTAARGGILTHYASPNSPTSFKPGSSATAVSPSHRPNRYCRSPAHHSGSEQLGRLLPNAGWGRPRAHRVAQQVLTYARFPRPSPHTPVPRLKGLPSSLVRMTGVDLPFPTSSPNMSF